MFEKLGAGMVPQMGETSTGKYVKIRPCRQKAPMRPQGEPRTSQMTPKCYPRVPTWCPASPKIVALALTQQCNNCFIGFEVPVVRCFVATTYEPETLRNEQTHNSRLLARWRLVAQRTGYSACHNYTGCGPNVRKNTWRPPGQPKMRLSNSDTWKW